uniref:Movement protein n=1 Tax=Angiostrongylus cantonensis TaxID=6313 RepID=A0A0K0DQS1_ANGCA
LWISSVMDSRPSYVSLGGNTRSMPTRSTSRILKGGFQIPRYEKRR